jgi:hypothetical protein
VTSLSDFDIIGTMVGAVLTLLVFSYLLGDNPLYRLAVHLFVGILVGYSFSILLRDVVYGMVITQLSQNKLVVLPLAFGLLLLFKHFPRRAYIGNYPMAYLVGVGAAVALGGALLGTLVPQIEATGFAWSRDVTALFRLGIVDGLLIVVGTAFTLMAFTFTAQGEQGLAGLWSRIVSISGGIGRVFLIVTFGVAFAGAVTASLSIFIGRVQYLFEAFRAIGSFILG